MSESYIGIQSPNRVSAAFQKEDFLGSNLSSITVGSTTYTNAYELDTDVDGSNAENNSSSSNQITPMRSQNLEDIFTPSQEIRADEEIVFPVDI